MRQEVHRHTAAEEDRRGPRIQDPRNSDSSRAAPRAPSFLPAPSAARGAVGGDANDTTPAAARGRGIVSEHITRDQFFQGSFRAWLNQNKSTPGIPVAGGDKTMGGMDAERRLAETRHRRRGREYALKMALTYRGQDPLQVHAFMAPGVPWVVCCLWLWVGLHLAGGVLCASTFGRAQVLSLESHFFL